MTTTEKFQVLPDYFDNEDDCQRSLRSKTQTNPRYKGFTQTHFTAGDIEQFEKYRDATNGQVCIPSIDLQGNLYKNVPMDIYWQGYADLPATCVQNTFNYTFHKFKKCIFVKIKDNKLKVFLPFSKSNYINEWGDRIKVDPKYGSLENFLKSANSHTNYPLGNVNRFTQGWGGNNCLLRYEFPLREGDSGAVNMRDMFLELCQNRQIPDMEFFINRRDFPILKKDGTEPYNHIFDSEDFPLLSHRYDKYAPILGGSTTDKFADIPIPTWDDWQRVNPNKYFPKSYRTPVVNPVPWNDKVATAVFRGGSTGCGVTQQTNPRLKVAYLSTITPSEDDVPLLDAGITNWNTRPRKLQGQKYLQTIDISKEPPLVGKLSPQEQSKYKYVINIDGHVTAFRLSIEMSFGSVILLVKSKYRIWYMNMLEAYVHYVPVESDLSDLVEKIRWCRANDAQCQMIANNALKFYNKYLRKNGIFDYLQKLLIDLKKQTGVYLYNYKTPLQFQLEEEYTINQIVKYPKTVKTARNISTIPPQQRSYSLLKGLEWIFNLVKDTDPNNIEKYLNINNKISESPYTLVYTGNLAHYPVVIKQCKLMDSDHDKENIHETFVSVNCINNTLQHIPNFVYVLGSYQSANNTSNVVVEQVDGITFLDYLKGREFDMQEYLFILIQLFLSLQIAQNTCGFVHWDAMPWNIVIQRLPSPVTFDYLVSHDKVMRVTTKVIPVIIDYGKSHVIYEDKHYGMINMYKTSTVQDVLAILFSSIYEVIDRKERLAQKDMRNVFRLMNFISSTQFRSESFSTVKDLKSFLYNMKKFSVLLNLDAKDLSDLNPVDFVDFILTLDQFPIHQANSVKYTMNIGNSRQVFDFILSNSIEERLQSYANVFLRIKKCTIPQPENLFFIYYTAQLFDSQLTSLYYIMEYYLDMVHVNKKYYTDLYNNCMRYISRVYIPKLESAKEETIVFNLDTSRYEEMLLSKYTEETFLLPWEILDTFKEIDEIQDDLTSYKNIIELVLTSSGRFKMRDDDKEYYTKAFRSLLDIDTIVMKTNVANNKTLVDVANKVYSYDRDMLLSLDCYPTEYIQVYHDILSQISKLLSTVKSK